jgi:ribonuclease E
MSADKDPWADLAETLGATPGQEPPRHERTPAPPRQPAARPPAKPKPPTPTGGGDWSSLASDLGIEPAAERPARPEARTPRPAPPSTPEQPAFHERAEAGSTERLERAERRGSEEGEAAGEGRGRRRRGRRGGRGRGRRDESRSEPRDGDLRRDERLTAGSERSRPLSETRADEGGPSFADDLYDTEAAAPRAAGEPGSEEPRDEEGRPRRRRGRRGGRRRGRGGRDRVADERPATDQPKASRSGDDFDDEPLPTGYGAAARPDSQPRAEEPRSGEGESGERRGRRRRRRRSGSGSGERRTTETGREAGGSASRDSSSRRSRRRGEDGRSSSRLSRGRRDDFTPVAGRFEEDDEGLEFLGVEEASRSEAPSRERRPQIEDDVLAESGLDTVREVPSWVEAIGIVIAANLDARGKSGPRK